MKLIISLLFTCCLFHLSAQWAIPMPQTDSGPYIPTDTVYMSPTGDDQAPGTATQPVRSFNKAISLLPYGVAGQQGGHAYGLIRLHPGFYRTNGWQQSLGQYQSGNTYKNVSLEGMGDVVVGGTKDSFATNHLLRLRGSHISIRNLHLQYSTGIGILVSSSDPVNDRQSHILIEEVKVDSVGSFSLLVRDADTVWIDRCTSMYAARPFADTLTTPCQWPSGVKFYSCNQVVFEHGEIGFTRGEGLNFHNTQFGRGSHNKLHDNSSNVYCDNGSNIMLHNNLIYTSPGSDEWWGNCPGDTVARSPGVGILLANENACELGGPVNNNCRTNCPLVGLSYSHVDSIFIHNNFILNCSRALNLWEGVTGVLGGPNCITNVFFQHNTVAGYLGDSTRRGYGLIDLFFPAPYNTILGYGYATASNIVVQNNLFSFPYTTYTKVEPVRVVRDQLFPVPIELRMNHNRWIVDHPRLGPNSQVDSTLPITTPIDESEVLQQWQPCPDKQNLVQSAPAQPFVELDYVLAARGSSTNVGALEFDICNTSSWLEPTMPSVQIHPNPTQSGQIWVEGIQGEWQYQLYQLDGKRVRSGTGIGSTTISITSKPGIYLLQINDRRSSSMHKVVIL